MDKRRIMILAPHTDDAEFGCGGTISKFINQGKEVFVITFSIARQSVPKGVDEKINLYKFQQSMNLLGVNFYVIYDCPVRNFFKYRQNILEVLINWYNKYNPDLVFMPSTTDTHQDHKVISAEGYRAFKKVSILGYEIPWNNLTFSTNVFSILEQNHIDKKIQALSNYITQLGKSYIDKSFIKNWARFRGGLIDVQYAEVFESIRWII